MTGNCANGAIFCETFESLAGGQLPEGLSFRNCGGNGSSYDITTSGALRGNVSVDVTSPGNFCEAWLDVKAVQNLPAGYVRFYTRQAAAKSGLQWFMLVENGPQADSNGQSMRMRIFDNNVLAWNMESAGDTVSPNFFDPAQRSSTVSLPTGATTCFELFYDNANDLIRVWMNGTEVPGLAIDNDRNTGYDQRWLDAFGGSFNVDVRLVRLGWHGSTGNTMKYDDIVVSPNRIGCN